MPSGCGWRDTGVPARWSHDQRQHTPRFSSHSSAVARTVNAVKVYGRDDTAVRALDDVSVAFARRTLHRDHGPVGLGQVDADALRRRARHARRRARCSSATPISATLSDQQLTLLRRERIGFVFQAFNLVPTLDRGREHHAAADARPASRPTSEWLDAVVDTRRARATGCATARRSCRAASSSASRWRAALVEPARRSSSPTSRPATSTRAAAPRCSSSCARPRRRLRPDDRDGHPRPARRDATRTRCVFLADGRIVDELERPDRRSRPRPHQGARRLSMTRVTLRSRSVRTSAGWSACSSSVVPRRRVPGRHAGAGRHARQELRQPLHRGQRRHRRGRAARQPRSTRRLRRRARRRSTRRSPTRSRGVDGVAAAEPYVEGYGQILGKDGDALGGNGPPTLGGQLDRRRRAQPVPPRRGPRARAADEVVINRGAAKDGDLHVGDTTTRARRPSRTR